VRLPNVYEGGCGVGDTPAYCGDVAVGRRRGGRLSCEGTLFDARLGLAPFAPVGEDVGEVRVGIARGA
jgi:hypothetical protein